MTIRTLACALAAASAVAPTSPAAACGGFFCNNSPTNPTAVTVNQAAERIIFAMGEDGTVTAVIQILYQGDADEFAWLLPVPGRPEIGISSNAAFTALQTATNPTYQGSTRFEGCGGGCSFLLGAGLAGAPGADAGAISIPEMAPVEVLASGAVGPYDYVLLSTDPERPDPASDAAAWLVANRYEVNDFGVERLTPYLEQGMNLLAFRLQKGNDVGSIRPVRVDFGAGLPSIPLRPTAAASVPDMGVLVWVLGEHRAVPANYATVELNEALIDWLDPTATDYDALVSRAADEAGGQAFVTEMAGPAPPLAGAVLPPVLSFRWSELLAADHASRDGALIQDAVALFRGRDGLREAVQQHVPLAGGAVDDFLANPGRYPGVAATVADVEGFDPARFLTALEELVYAPLEETAQLFEGAATMTRLYTTMSPEEMTMDPVFDVNPDLGDVSNQHSATVVRRCGSARVRVELADGTDVHLARATWPFQVGDLPAARRVLRLGPEGQGEVVDDQRRAILREMRRQVGVSARNPEVSSGCAVSLPGQVPGALLGLLVALGLLAFRRRS